MDIRPIRTDDDHKAALARIDQLMEAEEDTPEAAELEVLAVLVERYEEKTFPLEAPSPIDAIRFRMEQAGYQQRDLAEVLGSRSRASEIMRGNVKGLSLSQIRRLHRSWRIPAEALIREVGCPRLAQTRDDSTR